jgi:hypothetical protein
MLAAPRTTVTGFHRFTVPRPTRVLNLSLRCKTTQCQASLIRFLDLLRPIRLEGTSPQFDEPSGHLTYSEENLGGIIIQWPAR